MHKVIEHRKRQAKKHICNICEKEYSRAFTLKRHKNTIHKKQSGSGITEQTLDKKDDEPPAHASLERDESNESHHVISDDGFLVNDFIENFKPVQNKPHQEPEFEDVYEEEIEMKQEYSNKNKGQGSVPFDQSNIVWKVINGHLIAFDMTDEKLC